MEANLRRLAWYSVLSLCVCQSATVANAQSAKVLSRSEFESAINQKIFSAAESWLDCIDRQIEIEKTSGASPVPLREQWKHAFGVIARCQDHSVKYTNLLLQKANNFPIEGRGSTSHNIWAAEKELDRQLETISYRVEFAFGLRPRCTLTGTYAGSKPKRDKCFYDNTTYSPWGVRLEGQVHPERRYILR